MTSVASMQSLVQLSWTLKAFLLVKELLFLCCPCTLLMILAMDSNLFHLSLCRPCLWSHVKVIHRAACCTSCLWTLWTPFLIYLPRERDGVSWAWPVSLGCEICTLRYIFSHALRVSALALISKSYSVLVALLCCEYWYYNRHLRLALKSSSHPAVI